MSDWNVKNYTQFIDSRTRPAQDLLAAIPDSFIAKKVYDLGCGPGNSTILLKNRWPEARVIGLDSSCEMLEEAKKTYSHIDFMKGDIAQFHPLEKIDCIFANASLQWVDDHDTLFTHLINCLNPGGVLAVQMPNNFHLPSHQVTVQILQDHSSWQPLLNELRYGVLTSAFYYLPKYYDLLKKAGVHFLRLWETEYFQEMGSYQEIFDWVKGTGLRPILSKMNDEDQKQFSEIYIQMISKKYPTQLNGKILFPFRRLFIVACLSGEC